MWIDGLRKAAADSQQLPYAMLRRPILHTSIPYQRGTALLTHHLLCKASRPANLHLWIPPDDSTSGRAAVASLLLTDFFNQHFGGCRLDGNLLFITHAVGDCVHDLGELALGDVKLSELWQIVSFSKYQQVDNSATQVIVSNPGWILKSGKVPDHVKAVVIDASHPRTLSRLQELEHAAQHVPLRLSFLPALAEAEPLSGSPHQTWLWSPAAQREMAEDLRQLCRGSAPDSHARFLVVNDDPDLDAALLEMRNQLIAVMKVAPRHSSVARQPWGIYHRLRQLCVPLVQFEAAAKQAWGSNVLQDQVKALANQELPDAAMAGVWAALAKATEECYEIMRQREDPAKFFAVWERAEAALNHAGQPAFVVSATDMEADILRRSLMSASDVIKDAIINGDIEFIRAKDQARRIAAGDRRRAILPGYRHVLTHLDIYAPTFPDTIVYPHEVPVAQRNLEKSNSILAKLDDDAAMGTTLESLGFGRIEVSTLRKATPPPIVEVIDLAGRPVQLIQTRAEASDLSLEDLARYQASGRGFDDMEDLEARVTPAISSHSDQVTIHFEEGPPLKVAGEQLMDIYYPVTEDLLRHPAHRLQPGMQLLHMVDSAYESLFDRVIEVLDSMASPSNRAVLRLWREAKARLKLMHGGNVRELHRILAAQGLEVDYSTLRTWLKDFDAADPQRYEHARIIAQHSGLYEDDDLIRTTFQAIDTERVRNRSAGRLLHSVLRAIVSGQGYKTALVDSRRLGAELGELFAAIELRTIDHIEIQRASLAATR